MKMTDIIGKIRNEMKAQKPRKSNEGTKRQGDPDSWPEPSRLGPALKGVKPFRPEMLPKPLSDYAYDVSERIFTAPDYVAIGQIVSLSSIIGRRCGIHPKRKDDWLVVPNLWGMAVGTSASKKTAALEYAMAPLYNIERAEMAGRTKSNEACEDAPVKRFIVNEVTVQSLIKILMANPDGLLVFRDELRGFFERLNNPHNHGDRPFFLEAWNGNGSFRYDTLTHGLIFCESVCLSILGGIQPDSLRGLFSLWEKKGISEDGLVQRFQLTVYPDMGEYKHTDRLPNQSAIERYWATFDAIQKMKFAPTGKKTPPALRFTEEAQGLFDQWYIGNQRRAQREKSSALESHFSKYGSLMPSLALIFYLTEVAEGNLTPTAVSSTAANRAILWCEYLESHARYIYSMSSEKSAHEAAQRLLTHLGNDRLDSPFTVRTLAKKGWKGLNSNLDAEAALNILLRHNLVVAVEDKPGQHGGRPTERYYFNQRARNL